MKIVDLINEFSTREELPVDVNDVLGCLKQNGYDDNIEFIGADMDGEILQGAIKIFHVRNGLYAEPERYVNIYYNRTEAIDWQRMICCKELIHLLDPKSAHTNDAAAIDELAQRIGLPPEMQDPSTDGFATNIDRLAEYRALALLLPIASRNLLMPKFRDGTLKVGDIARMADIPARYVGFVMHDVWEQFYRVLTTPPAEPQK